LQPEVAFGTPFQLRRLPWSAAVELKKLFVAVEVPADIGAELARVQLPPTPGVRLVTPDLFHVTVHFRGLADVEGTIAALSTVRSPPFALGLAGVGQFPGRDGEVTLWAGVAPNDGLSALHAAVGSALGCDTWQPESRPYRPHLTLGRCKASVDRAVIDAFLDRGAPFAVPAFQVESFSLWVSTQGPSGPIYTVEGRFPLVSTAS
jgi:RNA 2',3'-cyclic 3'-phosphodiesterase